MSPPQENVTYDIIFAGGGAAACITAGRLAAADPTLRILIVEAGPHTKELADHTQPARCFRNLGMQKETFTFHEANPNPALLGRSAIVPSGRALGGGSAVNFVVYNRAPASDYDNWETVHGNKGWGSADILPLLRKAETYEVETTNDAHGTNGPIHISYPKNLHSLADDFLEASAYDKERSLAQDINDHQTVDKYGPLAKYVNGTTGRRSDAAHCYIYNQDHNPNLEVTVRHRVVRVLFEGTRATGIEYVDDSLGRKGGEIVIKTAYASRLVVLAAGTFGSPSILERSGIGAASVLKENGIDQIVDLPGVGEHYMDHMFACLPFVASSESDTIDELLRGTDEEIAAHEKQWLNGGQGLMSHNGFDAGVKLRPNAKDLAAMSPEFDHRWKTFFADVADKPVMLVSLITAYTGLNPAVPRGKYFTMAYYTAYPSSLGRVHIKSGLNPYAKLDFDAGFLKDPADVVILRWTYKKARELSRRMKSYRGEVKEGHPKFSPDSPAAIQTATASPVSLSAPDIVYSKEDDDAIDEYHRRTIETTWHSLGTCAMKSRDVGGVVDNRLNVYGVQGLKVADSSICPENIGANTYNNAIAIGEKAAVIIAEDLGIAGVTKQ